MISLIKVHQKLHHRTSISILDLFGLVLLEITLQKEGDRRLRNSEFKCPICNETFENPTDLRNHRLQKHRSMLDEIKFKAQQLKRCRR